MTDKDNNGNIILIGMPASGKSTVGVILAKIFGKGFVDTDLVIQKNEGTTLQNILEKEGINTFLKCEEKALLSIDATDTVISTGGSAIYSEEAMKYLSERATVVYLKVQPEDLKKRLKNLKERGVVMKPGESFEEMYAARSVLYERYADITIIEEGEQIEETVCAVAQALRKQ